MVAEFGAVVFAEIRFDYLWIFLDFGGRAFGDFYAVIQHRDVFTHRHHHTHRVFDEEDGEIETLMNLADQADQVDFLRGVHAGGGFVQEKQARLGGEGADNLQAALFSVGQRGGGGIAKAVEIEQSQQLIDAGGHGGFIGAEGASAHQGLKRRGGAVEIAGDPDVVEDAQASEKADVLKRAGDAERGDLVGAEAGELFSVEAKAARRRGVNAGDKIKEGGFARAVGADEAVEFAGGEREIHGVDCGESAEADGGLVELEEGRGHQTRALPKRTLNRPWGRTSMSTISRNE